MKSIPVDIEAVSVSSPAPAEALIEEEITESGPVTPVTPLYSDQRLELQCSSSSSSNSIQSSNNNITVVTAEETVVADINNIEQPRDLVTVELQYTVADVNILDTAELELTDNLHSDHTKLESFQEMSADIVVDKPAVQGEVGMYRVDTTDKVEKTVTTSSLNGHSLELSAHNSNETASRVANGDVSSFGRLASKEFDVVVKLDTGEKRFGFSVIGGIDEGFPARVESIARG